jgi:tetratricopeptide (TPR) repeat protein
MTDSDFVLMHRLNAILGWVELGNIEEAKEELRSIPSELQQRMEVLEIRWIIGAQEGDWDEALRAAEGLVKHAPDKASGWLHRAYAMRRAASGGIPQAAEALLPAVEKFPREATIPYNLACYACQMAELEEARRWLAEAVKRGGLKKIKGMALRDPDLEPLWKEIRSQQ